MRSVMISRSRLWILRYAQDDNPVCKRFIKCGRFGVHREARAVRGSHLRQAFGAQDVPYLSSLIQRLCGPERVTWSRCFNGTHSKAEFFAMRLNSTTVGFTR